MRDKLDKPIKLTTFLVVLLALAVVAALLIRRQNSDIASLEAVKKTLNEQKLEVYQARSERTREVNIADTAEYVAQRARENGYLMPGEIRFVVINPEMLVEGEIGYVPEVEVVAEAPAAGAAPDFTEEAASAPETEVQP
ncbi:MAG: septum formation initiator family protein [Clostridia bacterium]|nr:septum formation initiator family protein [Clostridia bacterium]